MSVPVVESGEFFVTEFHALHSLDRPPKGSERKDVSILLGVVVRRTGYQELHEPILLGEPELAAVAAQALAAPAEVDRYTHGFHTWPAGIHPDATALLIAALPGRSVMDPFCGGGTVLVEARAAGRRAVGRDVSPIAELVARGRASSPSEEVLTAVRSAARKLVAEARKADKLPPERIANAVREWYSQHVACELESLRMGISACDKEIRPYLWLCFSSILIKTSYRQSDTRAAREKKDRPQGTTAILFHKKIREYARRAAALREAVPAGTPEPDVAISDARSFRLSHPVDLVLTSPPYPSTYDYLPMQHLRNVWLGFEEGTGEIGARRYWREGGASARREWEEDTVAWTRRAAAALEPGGHLVVVIGDGLTPSGPIDTSAPTEDAGTAAGLVSVARASVERTDHARETIRWEHCFVFRKSPSA